MNYYKEQFEQAAKTGRSVLILKSVGNCDCLDTDSLINSEPDPKCKKCYGTGKTRISIKTPKIRYELSNSGKYGYLESIDLTKTTNEIYSFYLFDTFGFVNNEDIIVIFDELGNVLSAFEVVNRETFTYDEFVYYEYFGKKIQFMPKVDLK